MNSQEGEGALQSSIEACEVMPETPLDNRYVVGQPA